MKTPEEESDHFFLRKNEGGSPLKLLHPIPMECRKEEMLTGQKRPNEENGSTAQSRRTFITSIMIRARKRRMMRTAPMWPGPRIARPTSNFLMSPTIKPTPSNKPMYFFAFIVVHFYGAKRAAKKHAGNQ
jgi:hypothetical protein